MKRAFTLIELLVVISIIGLILAIALPNVSKMLDDANEKGAYVVIRGMLETARMRAKAELTTYGVCFYVDYRNDRQYAAFVRYGGNPPHGLAYGNQQPSYWNRYAERHEVVQGTKIYALPPGFRVRPIKEPYRHMIIVMYTNKGVLDRPPRNFRYIIYDPDEDDDGLGDQLQVPVTDITGSWTLYEDPTDPSSSYGRSFPLATPIEDIVTLENGSGMPYTEFDNAQGIVFYNWNDYQDLTVGSDTTYAEDYVAREGEPFYFDHLGRIIRGEKGLN